MTGELATTSDPAQLIPGAPEELRRQADALDDRARDAERTGEALRRIEAGAWTGTAADSWRRAHDAEVPRWYQAADSLDTAAGALRAHADVLDWAQRRAATTAMAWNEAEQATADARRHHEQSITNGATAATFADPGAAQRQAAQEALGDAREQVARSSSRLAQILHTEAEIAPQDSQKQADVNFYTGIWDSVSGAVGGVVNAVVDPAGAAAAAAAAVTHPVRTAKDLVAWDDWASGRGDTALGKVTGSGLLTLGTYGVGKAASLARHPGDHRSQDPADGLDPPDPRVVDPLAPAVEYATRGPKLDHVFVPKHKLDPLVERFGDRETAMAEIVRQLGDRDGLPESGPFEVTREIAGQPVHIRGAVVDGTPKIGTVFTP